MVKFWMSNFKITFNETYYSIKGNAEVLSGIS